MLPDVGLPEILLIFVVALIIFGPAKIPELGRTIGGFVREVRRTANEITQDFTGGLDDTPPTRPRTPQAVCRHCGNLSPIGHKFCGHCGEAMS